MVLLRNINQVWDHLHLVVAFKASLVYQEGDKMEIKQLSHPQTGPGLNETNL